MCLDGDVYIYRLCRINIMKDQLDRVLSTRHSILFLHQIRTPPPDNFLSIDYCDNDSFLLEAYQFWMVLNLSHTRNVIPPQTNRFSFGKCVQYTVQYMYGLLDVQRVCIMVCAVAEWNWMENVVDALSPLVSEKKREKKLQDRNSLQHSRIYYCSYTS